ncbi:MAG TPA: signal peptide peptidase SppA, partial [Cyanothece sp. UBA12306]|nr:signal peptide peptidase SppA [Cyanothece sp. UBA12306]
TAKFADLATNTRPKSPEELEIYQRFVRQIYEVFIERVAKSRNLSKTQVQKLAQGRVWSGKNSEKLGLIDSIGGLDSTIDYAVKQANLGTDWQIKEYPNRRLFGGLLLKKNLDIEEAKIITSIDPLTKELIKFKDELSMLSSLNDPKGIYSILPFNWRLH